MSATRVSIPLIVKGRWTGGHSYLVNLFTVMRRFEDHKVELVLYASDDALEEDLAPFRALPGAEVIASSVFRAGNAPRRLARALATGVDREAVRLFQRDRIDVTFEPAVFHGWRSPIPAIAWLPDFQHRRLRQYFSRRRYWRREIGIRAQVASGRLLMLSSEDARADCELFYPSSAGRTAVVHFAVPVTPDMTVDSPAFVASAYRLPASFFFLPNQFWKHKNHAVVIDALRILKARGSKVVVAATGNPSDVRHPGHFLRLRTLVVDAGLEEMFRFLGMVPRGHLYALLRGAKAMINPSRFEGWSTTVEEARALRVPMILSDIPVHREQGQEGARYFAPDDPESLAALLEGDVARAPEPAPRLSGGGAEVKCAEFAAAFSSVVERARVGLAEKRGAR